MKNIQIEGRAVYGLFVKQCFSVRGFTDDDILEAAGVKKIKRGFYTVFYEGEVLVLSSVRWALFNPSGLRLADKFLEVHHLPQRSSRRAEILRLIREAAMIASYIASYSKITSAQIYNFHYKTVFPKRRTK